MIARADENIALERCEDHTEEELPDGEFYPCCIAKAALKWLRSKPPRLGAGDLDNLLYTLSEGGEIENISADDAMVIWQVVDQLRQVRLPRKLKL